VAAVGWVRVVAPNIRMERVIKNRASAAARPVLFTDLFLFSDVRKEDIDESACFRTGERTRMVAKMEALVVDYHVPFGDGVLYHC